MPRMFIWALLTVFLFCAALFAQETHPGSIFAVSLYKAHLMSLGGWGGYWLDRALFPYARPHEFLGTLEEDAPLHGTDAHYAAWEELSLAPSAYPSAMMRRAVIVAACLICVGLGA